MRDRRENFKQQSRCPKGHFVTPGEECSTCARIGRHFCPNGHDKRVTGTVKGGRCLECKREKDRRANYKEIGHIPAKPLHSARYVKNLLTIRNELGLTRKEMAHFCRIDDETYRRIELKLQKAGITTQRNIVQGVVNARRHVIRERKKSGELLYA